MVYTEEYMRGVVDKLRERGWPYHGVGSDWEPDSTKWCNALLRDGAGVKFRNGLHVIDWGCGYGRFYNWLSSKLERFYYYGFEPTGTTNGDILINMCKEIYTGNCEFGVIEDIEFVNRAVAKSDVVILGSIFTHITIENANEIIKTFKPLLNNGGYIVFSVIIGSEYKLEKPGLYGTNDTYEYTNYTSEQIVQLAINADCNLIKVSEYPAGPWKHDIFRMENFKN